MYRSTSVDGPQNFAFDLMQPSNEAQSSTGTAQPLFDPGTRLYKKRFWMLFVFCLCNMGAGAQVPMYSVITNVIECYHDVSPFAVNLTSLIFPIMYIVLVLPVSGFISRFDVKVSVVCGAILNCLSAVIQCFSVNPDGFPLVMISQSAAALAHLFITPLPPRISALWFGPSEQGRAISVMALANQMGYCLGFLLPSSMVTNNCNDPQRIREGRVEIAYFMSGYNLIAFLLVITFKRKPPIPPSESSKVGVNLDYKKSLINLSRNGDFIKHLFTHGMVIGTSVAIGVLLNQMFEPIYEGSEKAIGWLGVGANLFGAAAGILAGFVLDSTHKFHETSLAICLLSLFSMVVLMGFLLLQKLWIQFLTVLLNGVTLIAYAPVGFDFGAELAFPEPESTITGLLITSAQVFSIILTMTGSYFLVSHGLPIMCFFLGNVLIASCITSMLTRPKLRRSEVNFKNPQAAAIKTYDVMATRTTNP